MNGVLLGIGIYIAFQLAVGLLVSRRIRSEDDYFLAGRRLGPVLATFSIFATWFGAETCMGAAGEVHRDGLSGATSDPFGYALCLLLMGLFLARPFHRLGITTLADFFRTRFSPGVERLSAVVLIPPSILWAAAQIQAFGEVLSASSDLARQEAVALATAVVIAYTAAGGLLADAVTDIVQGIALLVGLVVLAGAFAASQGGVAAVGARIASLPSERLDLSHGSFLATAEAWAVPIVGSLVAQELLARVLASRSPRVAARSAVAAAGLYLAFGGIPVLLALAGTDAVGAPESSDRFLVHLASGLLPPVLYVLFAGALVSAILSTVDSALLVASSFFVHNLIVPVAPAMSDRARVRLARLSVVAGGLAAYALARGEGTIHDLVFSASAFASSGIFVATMAGLFTRAGGAASAYGALLAGTGVWLGGTLWDFEAPYLLSLAAAAAAYGLLALNLRGRTASKGKIPPGGATMRSIWKSVLAVGLLLSLAGAPALAREKGGRHEHRARRFDPVTMTIVKVIRKLELDPETAGRYAALASARAEAWKEGMERRKELAEDLEELLENGNADPAEAEKLLDAIRAAEDESREAIRKIEDEIRSLLGPVGAARAFLVEKKAMRRFFHGMRRHGHGEADRHHRGARDEDEDDDDEGGRRFLPEPGRRGR